MGLLGRVRGWFQSGESEPSGRGEPSFEAYLEAAGEKLRDFAVAISKLESELLSVKERVRGLERQASGFRAQAEQAAARNEADGARTALEREFACKRQLEAQQRSAANMEEGIRRTKARFAAFKQAVDEASGKHDKLTMRKLAASAEWEAGKAVAAQEHEEQLRRLSDESLAAEALSELRQAGKADAIDDEIAKLLRERKPGQ
jgi:phage shock protein A